MQSARPRPARKSAVRHAGHIAYFRSHGVRIAIATGDDETAGMLLAALPPRATPDRRGPVDRSYRVSRLASGGFRLEADGEILMPEARFGEVARCFEIDVDRTVAVCSRQCVLIPGYAVEWRSRAIAIPGDSRTGAPAIAAALVRGGASLLCSVWIPIDDGGTVHPHQRRVPLEEADGRFVCLSPEELGGSRCDRPLPLARVVLTPSRVGAEYAPHEVGLDVALKALLPRTPRTARAADEVADTLLQALRAVRIDAGAHDSPQRVADALLV